MKRKIIKGVTQKKFNEAMKAWSRMLIFLSILGLALQSQVVADVALGSTMLWVLLILSYKYRGIPDDEQNEISAE